MSHLGKPTSLLAAALTFVLVSASAHGDAASENEAWVTRHAIQAETGQQIPAGAFGIVQINRPREVTLLDLRGMAGSGDVVLRTDESGYCLTFPLRFIAGDFGGNTISGNLADPIFLVLESRRVAKALANGHDVVSDMYRISKEEEPDVDIIIKAGLSEDYGFVLNPGRNIMTDIWGLETRRIACTPV